MSLILLNNVKPHLKIDQATDDTVLQGKLDAAEAYVSRETGGTGALGAVAVTEIVDGGTPALRLTKFPIVTVETVTTSTGIAIDMSGVTVDKEAGILRSASKFCDDWYTVAYHSGYATAGDLSDDLVEVVRLMTQHFYTTQRGTGRKGTGGSPESSTDAFVRAQQILDDFRPAGFA